MLAAARLCQIPVATVVSSVGRTQLTCIVRNFAQQTRAQSLRKVKTGTIKERLMAPAGDGGNNYSSKSCSMKFIHF